MRTFAITLPLGRPLSVNQVYGRMHHHDRADAVKVWRDGAAEEARSLGLPTLDRVEITATPYHANRRYVTDVGGCLPSVKAAVDGLVDAGVLLGDGPTHVLALTFTPVQFSTWDGLMLILEEAP